MTATVNIGELKTILASSSKEWKAVRKSWFANAMCRSQRSQAFHNEKPLSAGLGGLIIAYPQADRRPSHS